MAFGGLNFTGRARAAYIRSRSSIPLSPRFMLRSAMTSNCGSTLPGRRAAGGLGWDTMDDSGRCKITDAQRAGVELFNPSKPG